MAELIIQICVDVHIGAWTVQVMYMYYLLGYRLLGNNDDSMYSNQSDVGRPANHGIAIPIQSNITQRSKIFRSMNYIQRVQVFLSAINSYTAIHQCPSKTAWSQFRCSRWFRPVSVWSICTEWYTMSPKIFSQLWNTVAPSCMNECG